ncbi:MAG: hypothetical protein WC544_01895 [Patescibacteria group bacterium]
MYKLTIVLAAVMVCFMAGCGNDSRSDWMKSEQLELAGRHEQAMAKATDAFTADAEHLTAPALSNLTTAQYSAVEECIPEDILALTRGIGTQPKNADWQARRGFLYSAIGEYSLAIRDYQASLQIQDEPDISPIYIPNEGSVRMCLAIAQWQSGDLQSALETFKQVLDQDSTNARAYFYRGVVHGVLGHKTAAVNDLKQAGAIGKESYYKDYLIEFLAPEGRNESLASTFIITFFANQPPLNRPFGYIWSVNQ